MELYSIFPFCLAYFIEHTIFKVYPCYCMYKNFIPFYGWTILHFVYQNVLLNKMFTTFCLFIHLLIELRLLPPFGCYIWTFVCRHVFEFLFSSLLHLYLGMELLGHIVTLRLIFWETTKLFSNSCSILHSCQQYTKLL